jgi:signal transduction histidine kinase
MAQAQDRLGEQRLHQLIDSGRMLVGELSIDRVLDALLDRARELTSARYAAIGVLDEQRERLERFLTRGVDELTHRAVGDPPRGRGVLGLLIDDPRPLRLDDVSAHPRSYGFPLNHPPMSTFLGVPVVIRGEAWGNLYLTEKAGGVPFDEDDEAVAIVLADWAAIAIDNARLYEGMEQRRDELERAVRRLDATAAIAQALGAETDLDRVLELIAKRARALVEARTLVILLPEGEDLAVAARAGELPPGVETLRLPNAGTAAGAALRDRRPLRLDDVGTRLRGASETLGLTASAALFVPLVYRDVGVGVLAAFDHLGTRCAFDEDDELLLRSFAASAATAVATAKSVAEERLRRSLYAAERERGRWARELHDGLLQSLGGVRLRLASELRANRESGVLEAAAGAVEQLDVEIRELRTLISELRPAALDDFGLEAALTSLVERSSTNGSPAVEAKIALAGEDSARRYAPEVETAVYRLVQEALTNVAKHAGASVVRLEVVDREGTIRVAVADDGGGFDPEAAFEGFGLAGMRERVALLGGDLGITSSAQGTTIAAHIPSVPVGDQAA